MNKVGAVILSRFNSSRLPGKALKKINGKEVLKYIVERVEQVLPREQIVIATSRENSDDPIAEFAVRNQINVYRGDLDKVSQRFFNAGSEFGWEYAVRVNGDNIFMDMEVLSLLLNKIDSGRFTFLSNVKGRTYPKGMSIEIVRLNYYAQFLDEITSDKQYAEHVTLYLYEKVDTVTHFYLYNRDLPEAAGVQMALDTQEDFDRTVAIINQFDKPHFNYNLKEIIALNKN